MKRHPYESTPHFNARRRIVTYVAVAEWAILAAGGGVAYVELIKPGLDRAFPDKTTHTLTQQPGPSGETGTR